MLNVSIEQVHNGFIIYDKVTNKQYVATHIYSYSSSLAVTVTAILNKLVEEHSPKEKD